MKITRYLALTCAAVMAAACMMFSASAADDVTTADNAAITDDVTTTDDADTNNDVTTDDDMPIDEANFPDKLFREYISENFDTDKNGSLSDEEIENATELSLTDPIIDENGIVLQPDLDLTGVEHLKKLKSISVAFYNVKNADLSGIEALTDIGFSAGNVSGLVLGDMSSLEDIYIYNSDLTELSLVDCPELVQCCFNNNTKLAKLEIKNAPKLIAIDCRDNALVSLKTDNCSGMFYLRCSNNKLTKLNITNCPLLTLIDCSKNMIAELDITPFNNIIDELKNYDAMSGDEPPLTVDSGTKVIGYDVTADESSDSVESTPESTASSQIQEKKTDSNTTMLVVMLAAIVIAGIAAAVIITLAKGGKEK